MDRVTKGYVDSFRREQSLPEGMKEADLFELFAIYCAVTDSHDEEVNVVDLHTGGGNDLGIDGLAIFVNGALVSSKEEAQDLLDLNRHLDVKFAFVQAKSSSNFSGDEMASFIDGVQYFFDEDLRLPINDKIQAAREIMSWIYDHSVNFKRQRPSVEMSFVTTGKWTDDDYLTVKIEDGKKKLESTSLFGAIEFVPLGADEVQGLYQRTKTGVTVEFTFSEKTPLPAIDGIEQAYLGVLPVKEYLTLIVDEDGAIRPTLFYDNVRDFQGENEVNREIQATLQDQAERQRFAVLNNGVTLIARELRNTVNRFVVSDYQIVNGCQTSHVLFNSRDDLSDDIYVPLKVIATSDEDVINSIIVATNRQTEVTAEDLFARTAFQKKLEALFDTYPAKRKLYYERRSNQYAKENVEKVRIISKPQQIRVFAAMFLNEPHRAVRYYSDLKSLVGTKIFDDSHVLEPYYVSAYAYYKLEYFFRNQLINGYYKPARYQILMAVRILEAGYEMPVMTANKMGRYANGLAEVLWSDGRSQSAFNGAVEVIDVALDGDSLTRDLAKTQSFTDAVKEAAKKKRAEIEAALEAS